jgi:hypothetical protein
VADLVSGQYERPLRIVAFDTAAGWARDLTAEIAQEALVHAGRIGSRVISCGARLCGADSMNGPDNKPSRCAIYTRKSTEHNLDLAFNSLDAQREACEA